MSTKKYTRHYEEEVFISSSPDTIFAYADNHKNLSSHMNKSSWLMGGGKMETEVDKDRGLKVGSHIKMGGKIVGINLFLDEVVIQYDPPRRKVWETVGDINLLVIDHYRLGYEIRAEKTGSLFKVFIDYNLPQSAKTRWLGLLLGSWYAKWCVQQMIKGVKQKFNN